MFKKGEKNESQSSRVLAALILMCCWPDVQPDLIPGDTMPGVEENPFRCVSSVTETLS